MGRRVLILGATSAIARATARLLARDGDALFLVARDAERLDVVAADLSLRGASRIGRLVADLDDFARHETILAEAVRALDGLDVVFVAHGVLGDPANCRASFAEAAAVLRTNLLGPVSLLTLVANHFEERGAGTIVVISSVAGDRGRGSHYVYGASKGALSLFLQGLRQRLWTRGVRVLTVKPGFVATPMTAHLERNLLFAAPETVARGIHRALRGTADVVYLPWFWRWILLAIRAVPERLFKRLKL
jgi:short-subunit dehydrogenase